MYTHINLTMVHYTYLMKLSLTINQFCAELITQVGIFCKNLIRSTYILTKNTYRSILVPIENLSLKIDKKSESKRSIRYLQSLYNKLLVYDAQNSVGRYRIKANKEAF